MPYNVSRVQAAESNHEVKLIVNASSLGSLQYIVQSQGTYTVVLTGPNKCMIACKYRSKYANEKCLVFNHPLIITFWKLHFRKLVLIKMIGKDLCTWCWKFNF